MYVLSKIFGDCPQAKILEVFADYFDVELSIPDILWLIDIPKTTVCSHINKLLDERIISEGDKVGNTQFYHLNHEKTEVKIIVSLVNYIVTEKLAEELKDRGLKPIEKQEIDIPDKIK